MGLKGIYMWITRLNLRIILTDFTEDLLRGIYAYGYETPSAVQSRAIVQILKGRGSHHITLSHKDSKKEC